MGALTPLAMRECTRLLVLGVVVVSVCCLKTVTSQTTDNTTDYCPNISSRRAMWDQLKASVDSQDGLKMPDEFPVVVVTSILILSFFELNEETASLKLTVLFGRDWEDERLNLDCLHDSIFLDSHERNTIWKPSSAILNYGEVSSDYFPDFDVFAIQTGGFVSWYSKHLITVPCEMDYKPFPFDTISCAISLYDARQPDRVIHLQWANKNQMKQQIEREKAGLPSHYVTEMKFDVGKSQPIAGETTVFNVARLHLGRFMTYYVLQAYIPNTVTVLVAGVSFFVTPDQVPARMSLGVSSLIAIVLQYGNLSKTLPKIGYIKMIDMWMLGCMCFVFFSILEFGYICYIKRMQVDKGKDEKKWVGPPPAPTAPSMTQRLARIDKCAGAVYLGAFASYVCVYVIISLTYDNPERESRYKGKPF